MAAISIKAAEDGSLEMTYLIGIDDIEFSNKHVLGSDNKQSGYSNDPITGKIRSLTGSDKKDMVGHLNNFPNHISINGQLFLVLRSYHFYQVQLPYFTIRVYNANAQ